MAVAALVMEHGGGEDEVIAALLHDAAEDQGGRPWWRRSRDASLRSGPHRGRLQRCRRESQAPWRSVKSGHRKMRLAGNSMRLVSAADKLRQRPRDVREYRPMARPVGAFPRRP